ncbi:hypothetical protein TRFO_09154 [Tritrichomonas foetus]|uniref:SMP-LTD domain-containing protein n=1 Tax=Tritrichomonas foetus TaxID=1144522 RepID=A0A1J4JFJ7_9EUKA|nr:hypothetical protein TRFO_09154 [Tritrichomonas foetus]|eukprot:OHS97990.1 hypothetical protein TRFO_09154 [Tritrichomonas foetus]
MVPSILLFFAGIIFGIFCIFLLLAICVLLGVEPERNSNQKSRLSNPPSFTMGEISKVKVINSIFKGIFPIIQKKINTINKIENTHEGKRNTLHFPGKKSNTINSIHEKRNALTLDLDHVFENKIAKKSTTIKSSRIKKLPLPQFIHTFLSHNEINVCHESNHLPQYWDEDEYENNCLDVSDSKENFDNFSLHQMEKNWNSNFGLKNFDFKNSLININGKEPVIDQVKLLSSVTGDYVEIKFHFSSTMEILNVVVHDIIIKSGCIHDVKLNFFIKSIEGALRIKIPEKKGPISLELSENTNIDFDIDLNFPNNLFFGIQTKTLGPIRKYLIRIMNGYIQGRQFNIGIDHIFNKGSFINYREILKHFLQTFNSSEPINLSFHWGFDRSLYPYEL